MEIIYKDGSRGFFEYGKEYQNNNNFKSVSKINLKDDHTFIEFHSVNKLGNPYFNLKNNNVGRLLFSIVNYLCGPLLLVWRATFTGRDLFCLFELAR